MRWVAGVALCAGCGFHGASSPGAPGDGATTIDAAPDGPVVDAPGVTACASPKLWFTDFSVDPTTIDNNGDGTDDFAFRTTVAGQFTGGVFAEPGGSIAPLDTQPKQDFTTRTRTHVRMMNTGSGGAFGATFWINVGYQTNSFAPLIASLQLDADHQHQTFTLYDKSNPGTTVALYTLPGLTTSFVDVDLDIDPTAHTAGVSVAGNVTSVTFTDITRGGNDDRWATVVAYGGDSQFDEVRVEVCP